MSFFQELKRRNVFRVAIAYALVGWFLAEIGDLLFDTFEAPAWVMKVFTTVIILGFPLALFFAWAYELTSEGIKREAEVDRHQPDTTRIGDLLLDPRQRLLSRGTESIRLPKLSYELLLSLVRHAPGIVTTDQLLNEIWGNVVVGDETVKQRVSLLRQALGDSSEKPEYIEVIRGVGYRLIAPVSAAVLEQKHSLRLRSAAMVVLGLLAIGAAAMWFDRAGEKGFGPGSHAPWSLAVLPFEDLSAAGDQAYFSDGIHDEIIGRLSKIDILNVTSRTSVLPYRNAAKNLREIARELGVKLIIEGSVRHSDDRVRITVQLIDADNDNHLWAQNYDRPLSVSNLFAIQSDVAEQIARELETELTVEELDELAQLPTKNLDAYNSYLLGRYHLWRGNPQDFRLSIGFFEEAIDFDPEFARAYVGLGVALAFVGTSYGWMAPHEAFPLAEKQVVEALRLEPESAGALVLRGDILTWYRWQWPEAEEAYRQALTINEDSVLGYAILLSILNRNDEAVQLIETLISRYPRDHWIRSNAAWRFLAAGDPRRAITEANVAIEIDDSYGDAFGSRGWAYLAIGEVDHAIQDFERHVNLQNRSPIALSSLAIGHIRAGNRDDAMKLLDEIRQLESTWFVPPEVYARVYVALGDFDEAMLLLNRAYDARTRGLIFLNANASWDPIRNDPRFQSLLEKMHLDVERLDVIR
ncbi:MAG: winged helix-turn-helix domain-containing protein [Gammaproteobacteria bacterium]|nr:winged helix-turn-helix domain-containing protein [Gammaproteobacteria bacterium]